MITTAPVLTREQRMRALDKGNRIRSARAARKREIKQLPPASSARSAIVLLQDVPEEFDAMKVLELLLTIRSVGKVKAHRILGRHAISTAKTIGGLTRRQRQTLITELEAHGNARAYRPPHPFESQIAATLAQRGLERAA